MQISLTNFKKLLHSLKDHNIALKVRTHTGWSRDYLHIIGFIVSTADQLNRTFGGIVLSNMGDTEGILINNISAITAFELDKTCEECSAHVIYNLEDNKSLKALILH